jgi:HAD superfamily hydrolase (TIGR01509 family)
VKFRAIIWDCDGVLIDSELLACRVAAEYYTRAGYPLTASEYIRRFAGRSRAQIADVIRQETGSDFAAAIDWTRKEADRQALFDLELQAVPGIRELIAQVATRRIPMAVASGSSLRRLEHSLKLVRLWQYFDPYIYSTEQVARGKPSPDVFLHAAESLGIAADQCLVIEDAEHGIRAGKAAGMTVYGFIGASHCTPEWDLYLRAAGADDVFFNVGDLRTAVERALAG